MPASSETVCSVRQSQGRLLSCVFVGSTSQSATRSALIRGGAPGGRRGSALVFLAHEFARVKTRRDADWPATLSAAQSNCQSWSHLLFWLPRRQCLSVVCLSKHARSWKRHRNDIHHIFTPVQFGPTRLDELVCALPPAPSVRNAVEPLLVFNDSTGFPPARPISKNCAQTKRSRCPGLVGHQSATVLHSVVYMRRVLGGVPV